MRRLSITTSDGIRLDARLDGPPRPRHLVVWCHPHPLRGGSMFAPLMNAVSDQLVGRGLGVLRFDFRGVGDSAGRHEAGVGEVNDVAAALASARELTDDVMFAGWSFGAEVCLRLLADVDLPCVAVAPPLVDPPQPERLARRRVAFVVGSRDQVVGTEVVAGYAQRAGARLVVVDGADHFFTLRSRPIGDVILETLNGTPT